MRISKMVSLPVLDSPTLKKSCVLGLASRSLPLRPRQIVFYATKNLLERIFFIDSSGRDDDFHSRLASRLIGPSDRYH